MEQAAVVLFSNERLSARVLGGVSSRCARSTTEGSEPGASETTSYLTREKQNPRHVEARRGFLGPL